MANDKNNPAPLPPTSLDEAIRNNWGPGPHPASGTVTQGTGGDLGKLMRRIAPPQPPTRVVRKGS
jgi:hypothetical protein